MVSSDSEDVASERRTDGPQDRAEAAVREALERVLASRVAVDSW